jgi:hypothetical protein
MSNLNVSTDIEISVLHDLLIESKYSIFLKVNDPI